MTFEQILDLLAERPELGAVKRISHSPTIYGPEEQVASIEVEFYEPIAMVEPERVLTEEETKQRILDEAKRDQYGSSSAT